MYGASAAGLAGVPGRYAMIEGLGFAFTEGQRPSWRRASLQRIVAKLYRSALRLAERVVFLNPDDRREFVERRIVSPDRAVLLGGIGLDQQEENGRGECREEGSSRCRCRGWRKQ